MVTRIREASYADYQELCKLFKEENRYHEKLVPEYISATENVLTENELKDFIESPNQNLFVCEMESCLLGAVIVVFKIEGNGRWQKNRTTGYIDELIVNSEYRGKKIGRKLMEKAMIWLESNGASSLELHVWDMNTSARKFYESLGFSAIQHKMARPLKDKQT